MELTVIFIVSFLSAILGAMGLGGGFVLLIYLTAFAGVSQFEAQSINLIFFIPVAIVALVIHTKNKLVLWKDSLVSVLFGAVGVFLAASTFFCIVSAYFSFMTVLHVHQVQNYRNLLNVHHLALWV